MNAAELRRAFLRALRHVFVLAALLFVSAVVYVLVVAFSPRVDERFGIVTEHALLSVQNHREGGKSVKEIVAARYRGPRWQAYHQDFLTETYVRCEAMKPDGTPITMQWFVRAAPRLRSGIRLENKVVTALNWDALNISPSLRESGHAIYSSPDIAY